MTPEILSIISLLITSLTGVAIAWIGYKTKLLAESQKHQSGKLNLLEQNTNSIKGALIQETQESYFAKGQRKEREGQLERERQRIESGEELVRLRRLQARVQLELGRTIKFLIVDDVEECIFFFERALTGCDVVWTRSAGEAIELLIAGREFDAIIVDERLGPHNMNGHELIAKVKATWPLLKTVLASGFDFDAATIKALRDVGPVMIISKPLRSAHLQTLLNWIQSERLGETTGGDAVA